MNQNNRRKDFVPGYIFIDCATSLKHYNNYYFSINPRSAFIANYQEEGLNIKRKQTFQCHYCDMFFRYKNKFITLVKHCSGRPGFIYTFQDENVECYENCLKHKKYFPFTVVGDLETTTGYIYETEGGSMFATSYCLMFNFHSKLEMTPITCLRSFGQNEQELKFITVPEKFYPYINYDDLRCFEDACNTVLEKKKKQAISTHCMIEMWMVCRCLKSYVGSAVKIENFELTDEEKSQFHAKADCNSFLKEYSHCYLCKFPLEAKEINSPDKPTQECSRLDFPIRKEYQFLKNVMTREEI